MNRTKKISRHKCFHSFHLYKIFNCFELIIFHGAKKSCKMLSLQWRHFIIVQMREREKQMNILGVRIQECVSFAFLFISLLLFASALILGRWKNTLWRSTLSVDDTDFVSVAFQFFWKHWTLFTASLTWHNIYLAAAAAVATRDRKKVPFIKNKHSK